MTRPVRWFVLGGLAVALVLAFGVSRFASPHPDGLERVATDQGLDRGVREHDLAGGPFADYASSGVDDDGLGTGVAGAVGVAAVFVLAGGTVWVAGRSRRRAAADPAPS